MCQLIPGPEKSIDHRFQTEKDNPVTEEYRKSSSKEFDSLNMAFDNRGFWVLGNGICLKFSSFKVLFGTPEKELTREPVPEFLFEFLCIFQLKTIPK